MPPASTTEPRTTRSSAPITRQTASSLRRSRIVETRTSKMPHTVTMAIRSWMASVNANARLIMRSW